MFKTQIDRTVIEQEQVESMILKLYQKIFTGKIDKNTNDKQNDAETYLFNDEVPIKKLAKLNRDNHAAYLIMSLHQFGYSAKYFDAGLPWLMYWIIHSLNLLDHPKYNINDTNLKSKIVKFLEYNQTKDGGFTGCQYSLPHLASTYAAVLSVVEVGTMDAYQMIDRKLMYKFIHDMKNPQKQGSFLIHKNGEEDLRAVYTAMILANLLNLDVSELSNGVGEYIASCQTYEGGLGCNPKSEAHGGYTFCGFAALVLLGQSDKIDMAKLIYWLTNRQLEQEGGFNGRTHKVVDACYAFWQGAVFRLINIATDNQCEVDNKMIYDQVKFQMYLLYCCQGNNGGLRDKPGKNTDLYHTCYALSGLSLSQENVKENEQEVFFMDIQENKLKQVDPVYNVCIDKLEQAREYFKALPMISYKDVFE